MSVDLDMVRRNQELTARIHELEEKVQALEEKHEMEAVQTSQAMTKLRDALETEQVSREILDERRGKELKKIESSITLDLNFERQGRQENEARILKQLDERCLALSLEIGAHTYGTQPTASSSASSGIDRVIQGLDDERQARLALEAQLLAKVDNETQKLMSLIDMERTIREEATMNMIAMIEKTRHRLQNDMSQARAEREAAEDTILRLLDQRTSG